MLVNSNNIERSIKLECFIHELNFSQNPFPLSKCSAWNMSPAPFRLRDLLFYQQNNIYFSHSLRKYPQCLDFQQEGCRAQTQLRQPAQVFVRVRHNIPGKRIMISVQTDKLDLHLCQAQINFK